MVEFDDLSYQQQQCFLAANLGINPNKLDFQFTLNEWTYFLAKEKKIRKSTNLKTMVCTDI